MIVLDHRPASIDGMPGIDAALADARQRHLDFIDAPGSDTWVAFRTSIKTYRDLWCAALRTAPTTPAFGRLRAGVDQLGVALAAMLDVQTATDIETAVELAGEALELLVGGLDERSAVNEAYVRSGEARLDALASKSTARPTATTSDERAAAAAHGDAAFVLRLFPDVAAALLTHSTASSDASWFAVRTAVDRLDTAVQALAATVPTSGPGETFRAGAILLDEAKAAMNAAGGHRLTPGAEAALSALLDRAGAALAEGLTGLVPTEAPATNEHPEPASYPRPRPGQRTSRSRRSRRRRSR